MNEASNRVLRWWKGLPIWERVVWGLVVLCLVLAAGIKPLVRWVSPEIAIRSAVVRSDDKDPWGNRWWTGNDYSYSDGPNGLHEFGKSGDDVQVTWWSLRPLDLAAAWARGALTLCALALLWIALWLRVPRSPSRKKEFVLAMASSVMPALVSAGGASWAFAHSWPVFWGDWQFNLLVPPSYAVSGALGLACFLFALWIRLRRPLEESVRSG